MFSGNHKISLIKRNIEEIAIVTTHGPKTKRRALFDRDFKWREFNGTLVLADYRVKPNGEFPLHMHFPEEELYYFLKGEGIVTIGKKKTRMRSGDAVYIPAGEFHHFVNDT